MRFDSFCCVLMGEEKQNHLSENTRHINIFILANTVVLFLVFRDPYALVYSLVNDRNHVIHFNITVNIGILKKFLEDFLNIIFKIKSPERKAHFKKLIM